MEFVLLLFVTQDHPTWESIVNTLTMVKCYCKRFKGSGESAQTLLRDAISTKISCTRPFAVRKGLLVKLKSKTVQNPAADGVPTKKSIFAPVFSLICC